VAPSQGAYNASAMECPSNLCLKPVVQPGASGTVDTTATCSAECTQDSDCEGELRDFSNALDKRCSRGFVCTIPFAVGSLCCRKLCVCKDFLGPSGATTPSACDPTLASTTSCPATITSKPLSATSGVEQETDLYFSIKPDRQVDLVAMVDNSPSMAPKVYKLNAQFPKLMAALKDPTDGSMPDLRVAIIDSDLGTGGAYSSGTCGPKTLSDGTSSVYGDLGRFQMRTSPTACTFNAGSLYLEHKAGLPVNYTGDISSVFACLAGNLGSLGCGMEQQLQAFEFALAAKGVGNELQQQMLRPSAQLGLVFLSDEDDCSAAMNDGMFGDKSELRTESASLRCATRAHMCNGRNLTSSPPGYPTDQSFEASFTQCQARTDHCPSVVDGSGSTDTSVPTDCSPLADVSRLALELKSLKSDPDNQILVAGMFGWPLDDVAMQNAKYKIAPVPNPNTADTQHVTVYDYWPICYDPDHPPTNPDSTTGFDVQAAGWGATGGLRLAAFVDEFGDNGLKFSICERDFSASMKTIGDALAKKMQNLCLDYKLVDTDGAEDGIQADCRVVWKIPAPDPKDPSRTIYQESPNPLPQCPAGATSGGVSTTCWQLSNNVASCPKRGQMVNVLRSAADIGTQPSLVAGTKIAMQCRTCPDLASGATPPAGCDY
jgi:hypothetical protein